MKSDCDGNLTSFWKCHYYSSFFLP